MADADWDSALVTLSQSFHCHIHLQPDYCFCQAPLSGRRCPLGHVHTVC